jgi:hypothetical protein
MKNQRGMNSMKTLKLLAWAVTFIFSAAVADVEEKREMKIVVVGDSSDDSTAFHWSSDDSDFDMQGMQLGETHSIVDESGRSVLITKAAEGFRFDVDGETIIVPDIDTNEMHMAFLDGSDFSTDVDVEIIGDHHMMFADDTGGVTIISGEALDATTKESIKAVLQSAGRDDEVTFIDGGSGPDGKHVRVIKKKIEIAQ